MDQICTDELSHLPVLQSQQSPPAKRLQPLRPLASVFTPNPSYQRRLRRTKDMLNVCDSFINSSGGDGVFPSFTHHPLLHPHSQSHWCESKQAMLQLAKQGNAGVF